MSTPSGIVKQRLSRAGIRHKVAVPMGTFIADYVAAGKYAVIITDDDIIDRIHEIERRKLIPFKIRTDSFFEDDLAWLIEVCKQI